MELIDSIPVLSVAFRTFSSQMLRSFSLLVLFTCVIAHLESTLPSLSKFVSCEACKLAFSLLQKSGSIPFVPDSAGKLAAAFCALKGLQDYRVCSDTVGEYKELVWFMLQQELDADQACAILQVCPWVQPFPEWDAQFSSEKPPVPEYPQTLDSDEFFYVLFLSDVHVDLEYTVGLSTECGEPICCRPPNPPGKTQGTSAGFWGDYACDAAPSLVEHMVQFIGSHLFPKYRFQFVVLTGDLAAHDAWRITREEALKRIQFVSDLLKENLRNVPVIPALGNHDTVPINQFVPRSFDQDPKSSKFNMSWLYHSLSEMWKDWLPKEALEEFETRGGFFSVKIRPDLRVISLNTNLGCNPGNWWLRIISEELADPDHMLHWLVETLEQAEAAEEKVIIISHISPDERTCIPNWWNNYFKIILRFESIIVQQLAGHTHDDTFHVMADSERRAFSSVLFPGSVTSWTKNPGFRVLKFNNRTKRVEDFEEYFVDLQLANLYGSPDWTIEYSMKQAYGLDDLSPQSLLSLIDEFRRNDTLFDQFLSRLNKQYSRRKCDESCRKGMLASMVNINHQMSLNPLK